MKKFYFLCFLLIQAYAVKAQPGALDSSFGINGKVVSETYQGIAYAVAIQPDGKIIAGGEGWYDTISNTGFIVVRYKVDGTLDESFGDKGRTINDLGDPSFIKTIYAIALQPDGKIVAAGQYAASGDDSRIAVMRFNTDGSIDTEFGDGGITITSLSGYYDIVRDMALLPDGRIVVTGDTQNGVNDDSRSFINCYDTNGVLDKNFGNNGIVIVTLNEAADINAIAITNDGKILLAGQYAVYNNSIILKYNSDGSPDQSFGKEGFAQMVFDSDINNNELNDMIIDANNAIITTGYVQTRSSINLKTIIAKFSKDGIPDSSFGKNGYTITPYKDDNYANAAVVQKDNKIIIAGYHLKGSKADFLVIRYNRNGSADSSFGINGIQTTSFEGSAIAYAASIQNDGKIILAGRSLNYAEGRYQIALVRYNGDNSKQPKYVRIKHWLHHHGFTWEDWPGKTINYYAVQRSSNGNAFNDISRVLNRNNQQYSYEDAAPLTGNNYYRLAAVSADGSTAYSNVIAIENNAAAIKIYPNPVKNNLQVEGLSATQKTKLTITDFSGNTRMSTAVNSSTCNWNVSQLKQGNYILKIESNNKVVTKKFVKE